MNALRAFFLSHHRVAALLIAAALCMKALVPAGYMIDGGARMLTIRVCADSLGHVVTRQISVQQSGHDNHKAHADSPCAFTALSHATMGGADPIQLALALGFILALGFVAVVPAAPRRISHLRPPLRGPPALA